MIVSVYIRADIMKLIGAPAVWKSVYYGEVSIQRSSKAQSMVWDVVPVKHTENSEMHFQSLQNGCRFKAVSSAKERHIQVEECPDDYGNPARSWMLRAVKATTAALLLVKKVGSDHFKLHCTGSIHCSKLWRPWTSQNASANPCPLSFSKSNSCLSLLISWQTQWSPSSPKHLDFLASTMK